MIPSGKISSAFSSFIFVELPDNLPLRPVFFNHKIALIQGERIDSGQNYAVAVFSIGLAWLRRRRCARGLIR